MRFWLNLLSAAYAAREANRINVTSNLIGSADGGSYFQPATSGCALGDPAEVSLWNLLMPLFTCCVCTWIPPTLVESWLFPPTSSGASIKHFKCQSHNELQLLPQIGLNLKSISFCVSWLALEIWLPFETCRLDSTWFVWLIYFYFFVLQLIQQLEIKWILRGAASNLAFCSWWVHCPDIQPENKAFHLEQTWRVVGCSPTAVSFVFHLRIIPISTHSQSCPSLFVLSLSV